MAGRKYLPDIEFVTDKGGPALSAIKAFHKELRDEIRNLEFETREGAKKTAHIMGRYMAGRVRQMTKRRPGTGELAKALENNIKHRRYGRSGQEFYLSSGDFPIYWAMINYGGFVSPEYVYGFWSDGGGKSDASKRGGVGRGKFVADRNGFIMTPRKPIRGFHYIAFGYSMARNYFLKYQMGKRGKKR
jgi:hypothetical protein